MHPSKGTAPAHVSLDTTNHLLHVTNYDFKSGTYAAYRLDKGSGAIIENIFVDNFTSEIEFGLQDQMASHAHQTVTHKNFIYVVDLGLNKILHYQVIYNIPNTKCGKFSSGSSI